MSNIKLGLYGGTFSPPHRGHEMIAVRFIRDIGLDELLIMPASVPPHKAVTTGDDPEKRFDMACISFGDIPRAKVSRLELDREGKSYTILTLRELFGIYGLTFGQDRIYLLCGADMFLSLDTWNSSEEIFARAHIVYAGRGGEGDALLSEKAEHYREKYGALCTALSVEPYNISSSEIREMIIKGDDPTAHIKREIFDYIKKNGLYGTAL